MARSAPTAILASLLFSYASALTLKRVDDSSNERSLGWPWPELFPKSWYSQSSRFSQSECVEELEHLNWKITHEVLSKETGPIVLWNPAAHYNLGDNLIGLGEKMLLEGITHQEVPICCANLCGSERQTPVNTTAQPASCDRRFFRKSGFGKGNGGAVLLQGGGSWGDVYETQQERIKVLEMLADCCSDTLVVSFPQGIYYKDKTRMTDEAIVLNNLFQRFTRRPVLMWRDNRSVKKAEMLYSAAQNVRTPDIALAIGPPSREPIQDTDASIDLLIGKGKTAVSAFEYEDSEQMLLDMMPRKYPSITFNISMNWDLAFDVGLASAIWTGSDFFQSRKDAAMELLSKYSIIVTDKMHMVITSMLMNKRCIYVDNAYRKLNRTFESMFDLVKPSCDSDRFARRPMFASSFEQAIDMAVSQL